MKTTQKCSIWSAYIIIAAVASSFCCAAISDTRVCQSILLENVGLIKLNKDLNINDPASITCHELEGHSPQEPKLVAAIDLKKFIFYAFDNKDVRRMQIYTESGMGLDVVYLGTAPHPSTKALYHLYLIPYIENNMSSWIEAVSDNSLEEKLKVLRKLKTMSENGIYPKLPFNPFMFYDREKDRVSFNYESELQTNDPKAVQTWFAELHENTNTYNDNIHNPQIVSQVRKLREDLDTFINTPSDDKKYIDKLIDLMEETNKKINELLQQDKHEYEESLKAKKMMLTNDKEAQASPLKLQTVAEPVKKNDLLALMPEQVNNEAVELYKSKNKNVELVPSGINEPNQFIINPIIMPNVEPKRLEIGADFKNNDTIAIYQKGQKLQHLEQPKHRNNDIELKYQEAIEPMKKSINPKHNETNPLAPKDLKPEQRDESDLTKNIAEPTQVQPIKYHQEIDKSKQLTDVPKVHDNIQLIKQEDKPQNPKEEKLVSKENNNIPKPLLGRKNESKNLGQKGPKNEFSFTPYIIGILVVLVLLTMAGAAIVVRRKSIARVERDRIIV